MGIIHDVDGGRLFPQPRVSGAEIISPTAPDWRLVWDLSQFVCQDQERPFPGFGDDVNVSRGAT